jgi:hypothetical protein
MAIWLIAQIAHSNLAQKQATDKGRNGLNLKKGKSMMKFLDGKLKAI